jgi:hypothetical protein
MANQVNQLLQPVTTPSGQTITTTAANAIQTAGSTLTNTGSMIVGEAGGIATGVVAGVVGQAIAPVVQVAQQARQVYDLVSNPSLGGALALLGRGFPPYRNELDQFSSYNYIFTLGCLTTLEYNFPLSYRTLGPAVKIIKSGGTGGNKIPSIYETDGAREFFIEDVTILNHCAPNEGTRTSNAMLITFKVIEPYSMGQFFQNLRTAALVTGHANYIEAPFLLSVKFIGYDDDGNVKEPFFSQRHFPIRLIKSDMKVTEAGAEYLITATPYNEMALTDNVNQVKTDVQLKGRTVAEVLQTGAESLTSKINALQIEQVAAKQKPAEDYYIISFPEPGIIESVGGGSFSTLGATVTGNLQADFQKIYESITGDTGGDIPADLQTKLEALPGATTLGSPLAEQLRQLAASSINTIGQSTINLSGTGWGPPTGTSPFQEALFVENEDNPGTFTRGNITYDTGTQEFTFRNMTRITDIIEEVLLSSEFGATAIKQTPDSKGQVEWFKIHTHVYNSSSLLGGLVTGQAPKIYVYRIVPYKVDASYFSPPKTESLADSLLGRQSTAVKAYNYIYTGQNNEIVDFDLTFNQTYYTGISSTRGQRTQDSTSGGSTSMNQPDTTPATSSNNEDGTGTADTAGAARTADTGSPDSGNRQVSGGGGSNGPQNAVARDWHGMLINTQNDMLKVDLTIHGDPYFLADAGIGNYLGLANPANQSITVDGSMNAVNGQVTVILNFRTPIDYDENDGFVKYPLGGFLPIAMFSGTYLVLLVENNFKQGRFTQQLTLNRLRNQDLSLSQVKDKIVSAFGGAKAAIGKAFGLGTEENRMGQPTQGSESSAGEAE